MIKETFFLIVAVLYRFGTLRLAHHAYARLQAPAWRERRLFGGRLHVDASRSEAQQLLLLEGERVLEERNVVASLLRPGMTVVDVGANIGYYLLLFQRSTGAGGCVICVEPSAENLPELKLNIAANPVGRIELHEVAIGESEGEIGLRSGINSGVVKIAEGAHVVRVVPLDAIVGERVDVLKIDVEGYEGQVLAGATALIARDRPAIFLELHPHILPRFGHSLKGILGELAKTYPDIRLYERREQRGGAWTKFAVRYLGADGLREIHDKAEYVEHYSKDMAPHTFWAVCRT
jgi:FkbM family methyltransferase